MPQKKKKSLDPQPYQHDICTVCGASLENFCVDKDVDNIEKLKKNRELCEKTGKANGEVCAKLFIAEPIDPELLDDEE